MRTILDGVAEFERAMIRARIKAALAVKRARGEFVGMAPYGHRVSSDGRTLEPEPGERVVLERVAQLRAKGASLAGIAGALNAEGLRSRSGGLFSKTQVARMVRGAASPAPVAASSDAQ
jgi:DNA invertase Pin-like site-specific DNA recombinase